MTFSSPTDQTQVPAPAPDPDAAAAAPAPEAEEAPVQPGAEAADAQAPDAQAPDAQAPDVGEQPEALDAGLLGGLPQSGLRQCPIGGFTVPAEL